MKVVYRCINLEDGDQCVLMSWMINYLLWCVDFLIYFGEV